MRKWPLLLLSMPTFFLCACNQTVQMDEQAIQQDILTVMAEQQRAWNTGSAEDFMLGYAKIDSLRFASGGSIYYGWDAMLERYRTSYPDKDAMGILTFTNLDITVLSNDAALVFGKYSLQRKADNPWGWFTLLFRKREDGWRIVHDHTSAAQQD